MTDSARTRRTPAGVTGDVLLWLAAIGGTVCIAAVLAATLFHVTLIMFKTGSMEPTIPTGSLAVVHEIPASDIRVGDIVTVERTGELPVTHRVTSVSEDSAGGTSTLTLRGDANPADDAAPYVVDRVRLVWAWVPGWASVVVWFSHPLVLGGLTVAATGLVTWAFWPRAEGRGRRRAGVAGPSMTVVALAAAFALAGPAQPAQAAEVETVVSSSTLTLTSISDPDLMSSMATGVPLHWQVGVDATPPDPGDVHLGLSGAGALVSPGVLTLSVDACPERWVAGVCAPGSVSWLPTTDLAAAVTPPTAFGAHEIGVVASTADVWLMMTVTLVAPSVPSAAAAQLRLQAWGIGTLGVGGSALTSGGLAMTGQESLLPPLLMAGGAIGAGILIAGAAGRRRSEL